MLKKTGPTTGRRYRRSFLNRIYEKRKQQEERRDITRTGHRKEQTQTQKKSGVVICADRCLSSRIFRCDDSSIYQNKKYCSMKNTEKEQTQTEESNNKKADSKKQQKKKEKKAENTKEDTTRTDTGKRYKKTVNRRMLMIAVMK